MILQETKFYVKYGYEKFKSRQIYLSVFNLGGNQGYRGNWHGEVTSNKGGWNSEGMFICVTTQK